MEKVPNANFLTKMHVFQGKAREHKQDLQSLHKTIRLQCEAELQSSNVQHLIKTSTNEARRHFLWDQDTEKYSLGTDCTEQQAYEVLLHLGDSQSKKGKQVGFNEPGAHIAIDGEKAPTSETPPENNDTTDYGQARNVGNG